MSNKDERRINKHYIDNMTRAKNYGTSTPYYYEKYRGTIYNIDYWKDDPGEKYQLQNYIPKSLALPFYSCPNCLESNMLNPQCYTQCVCGRMLMYISAHDGKPERILSWNGTTNKYDIDVEDDTLEARMRRVEKRLGLTS